MTRKNKKNNNKKIDPPDNLSFTELNATYKPIGVIRTPYIGVMKESASNDNSTEIITPPYQPRKDENHTFYIEIDPAFQKGLRDLEKFSYIFVIFHMHLQTDLFHKSNVKDSDLHAFPPWIGGKSVGLFSSRSPRRPNPIGMSIVHVRAIESNRIYVDGIDTYDGTPVLDIKPYIARLDSKDDGNNGWLDLENDEIKKRIEDHLRDHIREHMLDPDSADIDPELAKHLKSGH
ncbi:MAG: tRNA (N6-threonylcarbamoyladenosine(37)-N6)-methyltransferase TrmO [Candidatus Helarchaeota archaeon]